MRSIEDVIIDAVDNRFKVLTDRLQFDKTYYGKVVEIGDTVVGVEINGSIYKSRVRDGVVLSLGDVVIVKSPNDNFSYIYIDGKLNKSNTLNNSSFRSREEILESLGAGWILGNSLNIYSTKSLNSSYFTDVAAYEELWGNPRTTREMIDKVYAYGFRTLKIPVSFDYFMDADYRIKQDFMKRVEEVVKYGLDNRMNVVLSLYTIYANVSDASNFELNKKILASIWSQLAETFSKHGQDLIFELLNEPSDYDNDSFYEGTELMYQKVNVYNHVCLNAIRSRGYNNMSRLVILSCYGSGNNKDAQIALSIPDKDEYIAVAVHAYSDWDFVSSGKDKTLFDSTTKWHIDNDFSNLCTSFMENGIPPIVTEWGASEKLNLEQRCEYSKYYCTLARSMNVKLLWWDNGKYTLSPTTSSQYALLNRETLTWYNMKLNRAIVYPDAKTKFEKINRIEAINKDISLSSMANLTQNAAISYNNTPDGVKLIYITQVGYAPTTYDAKITYNLSNVRVMANNAYKFAVNIKTADINNVRIKAAIQFYDKDNKLINEQYPVLMAQYCDCSQNEDGTYTITASINTSTIGNIAYFRFKQYEIRSNGTCEIYNWALWDGSSN